MVKILLISILICGGYALLAQPASDTVNQDKNGGSIPLASLHAEKVYLQLDGKVYTTGNIIWFKAIVSSAHNHIPTSLSRILYVELINSNSEILEKKLIRLENGIGQGFFELEDYYQSGTYLVRAYTNWNRNFGADFFFEEYIQVYKNLKNNQDEPISNVTLMRNAADEHRLQATFNPLDVDSLHKNNLKISIKLDNQEDSLFLKKGDDNLYRLDYILLGESQFVNLEMRTDNDQTFSQTVVLDRAYLDLQFLPESGEMVHGLGSKIGFKAVDAQGKGKLIHGDIIDEDDSLIASFRSNQLGMGSFRIMKPDRTRKYYARIKTSNPENPILLHPLPAVAPKGNVMSIEKQENHILLMARSNYLKNDSIFLDISCRGVRLYRIQAVLTLEGTINLRIQSSKLPEGIIAFTMRDHTGQAVAERIYFNERPESRLRIKLATDEKTYKKRELTQLSIEITDTDHQPIPANLSLLVINKKQLGKIQQQRQNILTYFLIDSELRGDIENPGFYFNKDSSMHHHLDALMLTQGWRKYNYSKKNISLSYRPESNLTVSGHVSGVFSRKKSKAAKLTLTTFGNNPTFDTQIADSLGYFRFDLKDEYGQNVNVLLQTAKLSGKKMNYNISLDEKKSPEVDFDLTSTIVELDSVVNFFVEKEFQRKKVESSFSFQTGAILLDEVEVTDYRLTRQREKVIERYGDPDVIIDGKSIMEEEEKWSYGLYSVLKFNFPDDVRIFRNNRGLQYARILGSDATLVVIDGVPVNIEEYSLIPNIPPSEVSSFEIVVCASNFVPLYIKVYGKPPPPQMSCGGIIAIYTHAQRGIYGANKPKGILHTTIPVFSAPREFYAPKYNTVQARNAQSKPDLRALVHWDPVIKTNHKGSETASFYNGDHVGEMLVVVEAVSENGSIGYREIEYEVKGKEIMIIEK